MSVQAMAWVLESESTTKGSERLVLLALANHVSQERIDGPWEAWPGLDRLAREAGVNRKTVRAALRRLEERGLVSVRVQGAPDSRVRADRRTNLYTIHPAGDSPDRVRKSHGGSQGTPPHGGANHDLTGGRITSSRGGESRPHGGARSTPLTSKEPGEEPASKPRSLLDAAGVTAMFEDFWMIYPRRVAKAEARRAWQTAIRSAPVDEIMEGARRYTAETEGRDPAHIAHPATWLRGQRWEDEPGSNAARPRNGASGRVTVSRVQREGRIEA